MSKKKLKSIFTLILTIVFLLVFLSIIIGIWYYVFTRLSFAAVLGGILDSLFPSLIFVSGAQAAIEFVKEDFFS